MVGDLGGGSLELIDVKNGEGQAEVGEGVSLKLGSLALMDASGRSPKTALRIARQELASAVPLDGLRGRTFYAVGGTWRSLAKLHMRAAQLSARSHAWLCHPGARRRRFRLAGRAGRHRFAGRRRGDFAQRRPSLAYGAVVLEEIIRRGKPGKVVISTGGLREGLLYEQLSDELRARDPLHGSGARV